MRLLLSLLALSISLQAGSVVSIPASASIVVPDGSYFCADAITVSSGGSFTASSESDVCVTPGGDGDISLPVVLSTFLAQFDSSRGGILIKWETESEVENLGFILDRLEDGAAEWVEVASYVDHADLAGQGSITSKTSYSYTDLSIQPVKLYDYRISDVSYDGKRVVHSALVTAMAPLLRPIQFVLEQNYPNPFNPVTVVKYELPENAAVNLSVYNLRGQVVAKLVTDHQPAGWYETTWNGLDDAGQPLAAGLYLTRLEAGSYVKTIKMVYSK